MSSLPPSDSLSIVYNSSHLGRLRGAGRWVAGGLKRSTGMLAGS
ncbi:hypothetical protein [Kamptonema formosum]|nr:hypothetical protein [Oscillatoria sp. PCC 10802]